MVIRNNLESVMERKGVSTNDLCLLTGLTKMTIWNICSGKNVNLRTAVLISKALKEPLNRIWDVDISEEQEATAA